MTSATAKQQAEALREVFDREREPMLHLAFLILGDLGEAEEVVQDAFAELWRRWDSILNPGGYLRTSVVHRARRVGQRTKQRRVHQRSLMPRTFADAPFAGEHEHILRALDRLSERQRTALILAYWLDLGSRDIAAAMGCSQGTAKSLVHRGLKRLRKELDDV